MFKVIAIEELHTLPMHDFSITTSNFVFYVPQA